MLADIVAVAAQHAAEILRPRAVEGAAEDYMAGVAGAQFLGLGRQGEKGIELAIDEKIERMDHRIAGRQDPVDIVVRVKPDVSGHGKQECVLVLPADFNPDGLAFQLEDAAYLLPREQLIAADMDAAEHRDRTASVDRLDRARRKFQRKIRFAASDPYRKLDGRPGIDIAYLCEALRAQKLLGDVLRGNANTGEFQQPHRGRFERRLGGQQVRRPHEAGSTGCCEAGNETATILNQCHCKPPGLFTPSARASVRRGSASWCSWR